jgi:hypothetical protein
MVSMSYASYFSSGLYTKTILQNVQRYQFYLNDIVSNDPSFLAL